MANQDDLAWIADRIRKLSPTTESHNGKMLANVHRMTCEADQRGVFADVRLAPLRDYFDDRMERRPFGSASWNMFAALHWLADNAAAIGVAYPTTLPSIAIKHWCLAFPKADCVRPHVHAFADLIEAAGQGGKLTKRTLKTQQPKSEGKTDEFDDVVTMLKGLMPTVIITLGMNNITNATDRLKAQAIAQRSKGTLQFGTPLKEALSALQHKPFELIDKPGHGYFLNERGVAVYERLKKSGQSRR